MLLKYSAILVFLALFVGVLVMSSSIKRKPTRTKHVVTNKHHKNSKFHGSPRNPLRIKSAKAKTEHHLPSQPKNRTLKKQVIAKNIKTGAKYFQGAGPHSFDYLLGVDEYTETWVDVVFLDYDIDESVIESHLDDGRSVICYVNIGAWEEWRDDADEFPDFVLGNEYEGWPGENWLDVREIDVLRPIMRARFELAGSKGCQGIDPDTMNGWSVDTGFDISYDDQLRFNEAMAKEIQDAGMLAGQKNDNEQAEDLVDYFDFAVLESCAAYDECYYFDIFIENDKPVYAVEYTEEWDVDDFDNNVCPLMEESGMSFILKDLDLHDDVLESCI